MGGESNSDGNYHLAYDRAVAHLKRTEYPQAVAAFSEAIALDSEAANAYLGRALAYRSLGNDTAALRDERAARDLGGPERSTWDRLVKRAYRRWRGDLRNSTWAREDSLSHNAFLLRQWTWQISNGGLPQWIANGYGEWAEDLALAAEAVGTDAACEVAKIVRDVAAILKNWPGAREAMFQMIAERSLASGAVEELFNALSASEERYGRVGRRPGEFLADIEAWFEEMAEAT